MRARSLQSSPLAARSREQRSRSQRPPPAPPPPPHTHTPTLLLRLARHRFEDEREARAFRPQELSNILYSYAKGNIISKRLLQLFEAELCATWQELAGQDRRGGSGVARTVRRIHFFSPQALANTLWSFATLRWYPARLLPVITEAIGRRINAMSTQEIANSCWAYARLAYHPGE